MKRRLLSKSAQLCWRGSPTLPLAMGSLTMLTPAFGPTLLTGSCTLHGGSEFLTLDQASGSTANDVALTFDMGQSVATSGYQFNGIFIDLAEGNVTTASGDDAVFRLGAASAAITITADRALRMRDGRRSSAAHQT